MLPPAPCRKDIASNVTGAETGKCWNPENLLFIILNLHLSWSSAGILCF